jgi:hypothetical protein
MLNRNTRTQMSCSTMRLEQDAIHCTQLTVGLLSLKSATCFSMRGPQTCSIMSHRMTSPASSRSELVMLVPFGLATNTTLAVMSGGHWMQNTVERHSDSSPEITPPMQWLDVSTTQTKLSHPATNLPQRVGGIVDSHGIVRQLDVADRSGLIRWK